MPFIFAIRDFKAVFKGVKLQKIFGLTLLRGLKKRVLRDFIPTPHHLTTSPPHHYNIKPQHHNIKPQHHNTKPQHHNTATTPMLQLR